MIEKKYCIDVEMTDAGKVITADQWDDFVTQYVVKRQQAKIREKVAQLICFTHHEFPEVKIAEGESGNLVIRVKCCCKEFYEIVDQRFQ